MNDTIPAEDFPPELEWLNVDRPLGLRRELAGHVVVIAFVHAVDASSRLLLGEVRLWRHRYRDQPVTPVVVHSPRLTEEESTERVRSAIAEWGLDVPVVCDPDRILWASYECAAWPTVVLLDTDASIRFRGVGLPDRHRFLVAIDALVEEGQDAGLLAAGPVDLGLPAFGLDSRPPTAKPLADTEPSQGVSTSGAVAIAAVHVRPLAATVAEREFVAPTALCMDDTRELLWIADTGRHRVVGLALSDGAVRYVVGSGAAGSLDGPSAEAELAEPGGLVVGEDGRLWIADTGNHLVRVYDPETDHVETILGTHGAGGDRSGGGYGDQQGLIAPTGLCWHDGALMVAMTGANQVWTIDPETRCALSSVGGGAAGCEDGDVSFAQLRQPRALLATADELFIADADNDALRSFEFHGHMVSTVIEPPSPGTDADADAHQTTPALAAPRGLAMVGDSVWIADSEHGALARRSGEELEVVVDSSHGLVRPAALAATATEVFVADAGAHCVWRIPLQSTDDGPVRPDLSAALTRIAPVDDAMPFVCGSTLGQTFDWVDAEPIRLRETADVTLRVSLPLAASQPAAAQLCGEAPLRIAVRNLEGACLGMEFGTEGKAEDGLGDLTAVPTGSAGSGVIEAEVSLLVAHDADAAIHARTIRYRVPVELADDAPTMAVVRPL